MSDKEHAWNEDPNLEFLYLGANSKGMRGYHAPIINPKIILFFQKMLHEISNSKFQ
ncbi:MAG: hypothetical protein ACFFBY_09585 [Promethearchaeota archaeon]